MCRVEACSLEGQGQVWVTDENRTGPRLQVPLYGMLASMEEDSSMRFCMFLEQGADRVCLQSRYGCRASTLNVQVTCRTGALSNDHPCRMRCPPTPQPALSLWRPGALVAIFQHSCVWSCSWVYFGPWQSRPKPLGFVPGLPQMPPASSGRPGILEATVPFLPTCGMRFHVYTGSGVLSPRVECGSTKSNGRSRQSYVQGLASSLWEEPTR